MSSSKESASPSPSPSSLAPDKEGKAEERSQSRSRSPEAASGATSDASPEPADGASASPAEKGASPTSKPAELSEDQPTASQPVAVNAHVQGEWQAVWSSPHNMYYFYNMRTGQTTWTNPLADLDPSASTLTTAAPSTARYDAEALAAAQGIDPELAYLDPSLAAGPSNPAAFTYTAKFNARTGAFARPDARNPDHVSEYERMKRMSSFYFDVDEWQKDVEKRHEEEEDEAGKKRKKPTKKDIESYKERKKQKKLAKTAWLRT
ncbi:hypothetical protein M0805_006179 [Coniferiporia weirii]|nr:hypothetical protein M0805_006179 [Coniferiporia weirii]